MAKTRDPLTQWLKIQEQDKEEAENQLRATSAQLAQAEEQLQALHNLRNRNNLAAGANLNGFQLDNVQKFNQQIDQVIQLQTQQVAIQESRQRHKNQQLKEAWIETRKTEMLLARNAQKRELIESRREQKKLDEMASVILRHRQTSGS